MKKVIIGVILALVLAIGGTFIYVISIDWNQHKDKISQQFYNSTGKHITFVGNVSFKIFPKPYLNAINAKIYNSNNKNEKPLLDIKNINAELDLIPLLKGEVNINKMVLDGVTININWDNKGLNWQGDLSADQRQMMEDTKMVLNSVSLKNAKVNFEADGGNVNFSLDNLSGEVMAQSVFGPFRIEGNYLKSNDPQGFAITIGKIEDSMATTLNAVFTHPKSSSYVRFDGSFQLSNRVLNGNVVVESQKLSDFVNDNTDKVKLDNKYNKPIVAGFDVALNKQMINLSNIVVKYEDTQGAGTIQIPNTNLETPHVKASFEFADLDLNPFVDYVKGFVKKYSEEPFVSTAKMKFSGDIKSIRASYDNQLFKNLTTSFEINDKGVILDGLSIILPGNAQFDMKGNMYPYDNELYYQADVSLSTEELMRLLKWLKIEPKATAASVYKKMLLTAKLSGNFDKVQVTPFKIVLDNTTFNGDAGLVLGDRKDIMLNVNANTLNFDNYINSIPEEIKVKNFAERMNYRFSKLGMLNDFDMVLNADANLVIYENLPFEKVKFKGNILQGNMEIDTLTVEKVANTSLDLSGKISGLGSKPNFENMQYSVETQDVVNMIEKFGLYKPEVDYNKFRDLIANGTLNGELDNFGINTQFTSGDLTVNYVGSVALGDKMSFDGGLEVKHPETVTLMESVGLSYEPQASNLGMFRLKSNIKGSVDNLNLSSMELNAGYSKFDGNASYDFRGTNKIANANLKVNKLEIEKYLVKNDDKLPIGAKIEGGIASFLSKPAWSKEKINYTPYADWEFKGKFDVADLSYKNEIFEKAKFDLEVSKGSANLSNFEAVYKNTPIKATAILNMRDEPNVNVVVDMPEANVSDFSLGGRTYSLKEGNFKASINLNSKATSEDDFVNNLNGVVDFEANKTRVFGMNVKAIYDDVIKRDKSDGLTEFANAQIANGVTEFDKVKGKLNITNGDFKIVDGQLSANNTKVSASGDGSIKNWTINALLDIKHDEPKYLQNYTISMKNAMDNPDVEIDVSKLFNIFKAREDQKEAEAKALVEAEKMLLTEQVDEQKKIAEGLVKTTRDKMTAEIDDKIKNAYSNEAIKSYEEIKVELNNFLTSFLDSALVVNSDEATKEQISMLKEVNKKALQDIEILRNKSSQIHLIDLQKQNSDEYEKIVKVNDELKQIIAGYNANNATYESRLAAIITDYTLVGDSIYVESKKQIDSKINELEALNNDIVTARNLQQANGTADEYIELNAKMSEVLGKITTGKDDLEAKVKEFDKLMEPIVKREEDLYQSKLEEEENQRLIKENTGSISVKKTGKRVTVKRDIEEIKEANEEISNDEVKVIDFTKKKTSEDKSSAQSSKGVIKKGYINR